MFVELSHVIRAGMVTYPGLPEPAITPHLTRDDSRAHYAPGTEFAIDVITMCGNTGTYLDSPFHRYPDGGDLTTVSLEQTVDVPTIVVRVGSGLAIGPDLLNSIDVEGKAVLLHTGDDARFGTPDYAVGAHYLTEAGAHVLADRGAVLVGIDAINIDHVTPHGARPAHTLLLAAGIPIVEHLTNLEQLPDSGALFTAVPLRIAGFGTVSVRAFAKV
ncbi:cyclase family protein [Smaragdicoccus niigatensis]|uniref:cyclase family protein n=1 Tax=Smaragdicoccus niigatensis TaxID=359359 RepID=UPI00036AFCA5|nr:cyclase family protein [Smaragdicoccus niigatensis]